MNKPRLVLNPCYSVVCNLNKAEIEIIYDSQRNPRSLIIWVAVALLSTHWSNALSQVNCEQNR